MIPYERIFFNRSKSKSFVKFLLDELSKAETNAINEKEKEDRKMAKDDYKDAIKKNYPELFYAESAPNLKTTQM